MMKALRPIKIVFFHSQWETELIVSAQTITTNLESFGVPQKSVKKENMLHRKTSGDTAVKVPVLTVMHKRTIITQQVPLNGVFVQK
jgi:hypothetical protein